LTPAGTVFPALTSGGEFDTLSVDFSFLARYKKQSLVDFVLQV
jgi:hypothetical protein